MSRIKQSARVMDAVLADLAPFKPDTPRVSDAYVTLLCAMWAAEAVSMQRSDIGIAMLVRDKLDAVIAREAGNG